MLKRLDQEEEEVEALSESDLLELEQKEEERLSRSLEAGGQRCRQSPLVPGEFVSELSLSHPQSQPR